ncbi:TagK domain-containing protein [Burkholderia multivorans]|nr:TagK domain-containing protein [Burkholderia multivorans]MCA8335858.1 TagK domain-containing protein [Burkholderia multivorans]MDN7476548.1 TagK domain-containing protein [Burkholderia multivorans]
MRKRHQSFDSNHISFSALHYLTIDFQVTARHFIEQVFFEMKDSSILSFDFPIFRKSNPFMRFLRLSRHRRSNTLLIAPAPEKTHTQSVAEALRPDGTLDGARADDDILGLLGIGTREGATRTHAAENAADIGSGHTDALIDALHARYWRALAAPDAPPDSAWIPSADDTLTAEVVPDQPHDPPARESQRHSDSIETFLSGDLTIEDAFGPLGRHAAAVTDDGAVPEILLLFAPPEFHAEAAHGAVAPPPLTRREHHALSVDSPLAAPLRKDSA